MCFWPALVCGWVNQFPILWPHTPVQTKLKCPLGSAYGFKFNQSSQLRRISCCQTTPNTATFSLSLGRMRFQNWASTISSVGYSFIRYYRVLACYAYVCFISIKAEDGSVKPRKGSHLEAKYYRSTNMP